MTLDDPELHEVRIFEDFRRGLGSNNC